MDPITAGMAAFSAIKAGVSAGKEIASLGKEIGSLFDSIDQCKNAHNKKKGSSFSANEEALDSFVAKKKAEDMENELRAIVIHARGYSAWQELLKMRAETRKQRKAAAEKAAKARQKKIENFIIYGSITAILAMTLGFAAIILLAQQGKI